MTRNNKKPLVSIIIPVHNEEKWINICVKSFLNQTYPKTEIIIVNDASCDKTLKILKKFDSKIKITSFIKNRGEARARTVGAKESKGDIIIQTDADAAYPRNFVEIALGYFKENPEIAGLALGEIKVHKNQQGLIANYWRVKRKSSFLAKEKADKKVTGCVVIKKYVYNKIGYYDPKMIAGTDVDFANRMTQQGYKIFWAKDLYIEHADPTLLKIFLKRIYNGAKFTKNFQIRWGLWPKGLGMFLLIIRNLLASFLPLFIILGFYNHWWLSVALMVFSLESFGPLIFLFEQRTMWFLSLKQKKWLLFFIMPFILFLQLRASAYGKLSAIIFPDSVQKSFTFDVLDK